MGRRRGHTHALEEMDALERRHQPEREGQFRQVLIELLQKEVHVVLDVNNNHTEKQLDVKVPDVLNDSIAKGYLLQLSLTPSDKWSGSRDDAKTETETTGTNQGPKDGTGTGNQKTKKEHKEKDPDRKKKQRTQKGRTTVPFRFFAWYLGRRPVDLLSPSLTTRPQQQSKTRAFKSKLATQPQTVVLDERANVPLDSNRKVDGANKT